MRMRGLELAEVMGGKRRKEGVLFVRYAAAIMKRKPVASKSVRKRQKQRQASLDERFVNAVQARMEKALSHEGFLSKKAAREAAFHLSDWIAELHALVLLIRSARWKPDHARDVLLSFTCHAAHHIAAAHRIVMCDPVTDIFEIGAVKGSGIAKRRPGDPSKRTVDPTVR